ncbi:DUF4148 domain-containing protein [Achromobacter sp. MY14]|uniref:DUF4148 domain-containing protein n=1 Tax=Achromobacter TaxID=222 RepID=UPI001E2A4652|nr:DUF4148 domain-containing protein [Achromobacter sp. MY14]MCD0501212.1 DUF4148 domain-containing protein [Achromobacter sp. MY14]
MLTYRTRFALTLGAALLLSTTAQASDSWHQTNTEIGYETAFGHATGGKSAEQVKAELAEAKADKRAWALTYRSLATPGWSKQGTGRTRAEVQSEAAATSSEERARIDQIYTPG